MYNFSERLVLSAYVDYIETFMSDLTTDEKMLTLTDLCCDGMNDRAFESMIVIDYLDKHHEKFFEDLEVRFD